MGLFDKNVTRSGKGLFSTESDPYSLDKINQQISNAQTRIQDAGYTPENTDQRNWFEKVTNLPQGQNAFFDTLELLGRPGNAIKNVIDKEALSHQLTAAQALWRGFSGKDKVTGADIAKDLGIESGAGQFGVGLGLDIATDPLTYVPGGALIKGLKYGVSPVGKIAKAGYGALESAAPAIKNFRELQIAPRTEAIKTGLGYMFDPNFRKTETLTSGQSEFLKNLEQETESSRRFMKENALTQLAQAAKEAGGLETGQDVGRIMESNVPLVGPRPYRELSTNPAIQQSAEKLMQSNADIRDFALEKGIEIPELAGYMTHILTQEEKTRRAAGKAFPIDTGAFGGGIPNKKILKQRTLPGSAEDINQQLGRDFFHTNAFFATGIGQQRLLDYIHAADLRRKVLSNPDFAQKFEKGMDIGKNVLIDSNNYKFLKDTEDPLEHLGLKSEVGGQYVVTPQAKMVLDRYQKVNTDEGTKGFMKALDATQNTWKKFALFSPGFHIRNIAGAMWNNYISGMNNIPKYTADAVKEVGQFVKGKESDLFKEYRQQGLSSAALNRVEFAAGDDAEKSIQKTIENISKTPSQRIKQGINPIKAFETSRTIGDLSDQVSRFSLYKWARDKGMSAEEAASKVKETQFDYSELTPFEQKAKKLLPFYTWSRKNIPFQIQKFMEDPRKFEYANKTRLNAQTAAGLNEQNVPDYMKEQFSLPVYGAGGKGKMLGLNLPISDLTKISNPLKLLADAITPLIKTPIELAANYNLFKGKPIEKFAGQEKQLVGGVGIPMKTAYALEQLTGQVGRGLTDYLQKPTDVSQENKFLTPSFGISSLLKPFDAEKYSYYKRLDDLKKMQDLMLLIQQQEGQKPRTVAEIKKGAK